MDAAPGCEIYAFNLELCWAGLGWAGLGWAGLAGLGWAGRRPDEW